MDSIPLFMVEHDQSKILTHWLYFPSLTVEHCAVSKSEFVEIAFQHEAEHVKSVLSSRVS